MKRYLTIIIGISKHKWSLLIRIVPRAFSNSCPKIPKNCCCYRESVAWFVKAQDPDSLTRPDTQEKIPNRKKKARNVRVIGKKSNLSMFICVFSLVREIKGKISK